MYRIYIRIKKPSITYNKFETLGFYDVSEYKDIFKVLDQVSGYVTEMNYEMETWIYKL